MPTNLTEQEEMIVFQFEVTGSFNTRWGNFDSWANEQFLINFNRVFGYIDFAKLKLYKNVNQTMTTLNDPHNLKCK